MSNEEMNFNLGLKQVCESMMMYKNGLEEIDKFLHRINENIEELNKKAAEAKLKETLQSCDRRLQAIGAQAGRRLDFFNALAGDTVGTEELFEILRSDSEGGTEDDVLRWLAKSRKNQKLKEQKLTEQVNGIMAGIAENRHSINDINKRLSRLEKLIEKSLANMVEQKPYPSKSNGKPKTKFDNKGSRA